MTGAFEFDIPSIEVRGDEKGVSLAICEWGDQQGAPPVVIPPAALPLVLEQFTRAAAHVLDGQKVEEMGHPYLRVRLVFAPDHNEWAELRTPDGAITVEINRNDLAKTFNRPGAYIMTLAPAPEGSGDGVQLYIPYGDEDQIADDDEKEEP